MVEQNRNKLTRRQFVKWSFGILAVSVAAGTQSFFQRLREAERERSSTRTGIEVTSLTMDQYLQTRPKLSAEFSLQGDVGHRTLESQEAVLVVNESAYLVLSCCDGRTTVKQMSEVLVTQFDVSSDEVQNDLVDFMDSLYRLEMMTFSLTYRMDTQYKTQKTGKSLWERASI